MIQLNYSILLLEIFIHNFNLVGSVLLVVPTFVNSNIEIKNKLTRSTSPRLLTKNDVIGLGPNNKLLKQYKESLVKLSQVQWEAAVGLLQVKYFSTTAPKQRFTNLERAQFSLPQNLKEILIGLFLGDLNAQKRSVNGNTYLYFEQGLIHKDYIYHLYDLFKSYCKSEPKMSNRLPDKRTGKIYTRIVFFTYSLPCFNEIYLSFYLKGKQRIPLNIGELLTPTGLAY